MGTITLPKYALDIYTNKNVGGKWTKVKVADCLSWDIKQYGRPNEANLEKYVLAFGKSLESGGTNAHLSESFGFIPYPTKAVIRYNHSHGEAVATWDAPTFMAW
jgi:hypothetical protein